MYSSLTFLRPRRQGMVLMGQLLLERASKKFYGRWPLGSRCVIFGGDNILVLVKLDGIPGKGKKSPPSLFCFGRLLT